MKLWFIYFFAAATFQTALFTNTNDSKNDRNLQNRFDVSSTAFNDTIKTINKIKEGETNIEYTTELNIVNSTSDNELVNTTTIENGDLTSINDILNSTTIEDNKHTTDESSILNSKELETESNYLFTTKYEEKEMLFNLTTIEDSQTKEETRKTTYFENFQFTDNEKNESNLFKNNNYRQLEHTTEIRDSEIVFTTETEKYRFENKDETVEQSSVNTNFQTTTSDNVEVNINDELFSVTTENDLSTQEQSENVNLNSKLSENPNSTTVSSINLTTEESEDTNISENTTELTIDSTTNNSLENVTNNLSEVEESEIPSDVESSETTSEIPAFTSDKSEDTNTSETTVLEIPSDAESSENNSESSAFTSKIPASESEDTNTTDTSELIYANTSDSTSDSTITTISYSYTDSTLEKIPTYYKNDLQETTESKTLSESSSSTDITSEEPEDSGTYGTTESTKASVSDTNESTVSPSDSTTVETEEPDPCAGNLKVEDLRITSSPFSLLLEWINPVPEYECNFTYLINWESTFEKSGKFYDTEDNKYTIQDLNACENYTVHVHVVYMNITNSPVIGRRKTADQIEAVKFTENFYNKDDRSLYIEWSLSTRVKKCAKHYKLQMFQDDLSIQTIILHQNNVTYADIQTCVNYTLVVAAYSENHASNENSTTHFQPAVNDPPEYDSIATEIHDDFVITKWTFGKFVCRPTKFEVTCDNENKKPITVQGKFNIHKNELTAKIENVEPHTNYTCCGIISNEKGDSDCSNTAEFFSKSKPPEKPANLSITQSESNLLNIEWEPPTKWNGIAENFHLSVEYLNLNYKLPKNCVLKPFNPKDFEFGAEELQFVFDGIIPASKYKIFLQAKSDGGWGEGIEKEYNLREGRPDKPRNLKKQELHSIGNEYNTSLSITWDTPCYMNGILESYYVRLSGERDNYPSHSVEKNVTATENDYYWLTFSNLKPAYRYKIDVQAKNLKYFGEVEEISFESPAGIPQSNSMNMLGPNASAVSEPWKSAEVYIKDDYFNKDMGEILYYSVIVATKYCEEKPKFEIYNEWPKVSSDNTTCTNSSRAYEATEENWNPFSTIKNSTGIYKYILGVENCTKFDCTYNKPLTPSTEYCVKIRGFTKNGYSDTKLLYWTTGIEPSDVPVGLIVGLIIGILAIAFIIAAVLFYTKGNFKWPRMETTSQISPAPLPVPIKKFGSHYEKLIENPGKIKNEFQLLSTISSDVTLSTKTAMLPMNKKKNRYINILPYDQTRVKLEDNNVNSTDYINASFIRGYSASIEYIASQGPTEATCPAFWQMIIEQNVKLIVMLTQFVESGKDKCYKYFPDLKEEYEFLNEIKIQCVEEELFTVYNKRIFKVIKGNISKKVTHIQFNLWPDFGVPDEVHHMIDFCEIIKDIKLKKPSTIVMHCSAGVGRTGTLIAVDILLQTIRDKRKVDIFGTVLNLRKQRMNMVQSERQYEFLYKCVYYVITNKVNPITKQSLSQISESNML